MDKEILQAATIIADAIRKQGSALASDFNDNLNKETPFSKAKRLREEKVFKNQKSLLKEFNKIAIKGATSTDIKTHTEYASRLLEQSVQSAKSVKEMDKIINEASKKIKNSLDPSLNAIGENIKTLEDLFKFTELGAEFENVKNALTVNDKSTEKLKNAVLKAQQFETDFGIKLKDLGIDVESYHRLKAKEIRLSYDNISLTEDEKKELVQFNTTMNKVTKSLSDSRAEIANTSGGGGNVIDTAKEMFGKMSPLIAGFGALASTIPHIAEATKAAGRFGVALDPATAILTGLGTQELPELQAKFKQSALAIGGVNEMNQLLNKTITDSNSDIVVWSGGLAQASRNIMQYADNLRSMGDNTINTSKEMQNEIEMAKKFEKQMGLTLEGFGELTKDIINDSAVRNQLMKMGKEERKGFIDSIRLRTLENHQMGMTTEQSLAAAKAMSHLAAQDPKERLKQAARIRAISGALGMQEQGEAMANAVFKGNRASKEEREAAVKGQMQMNEKFMAKSGESFGNELFMSTLGNMPDMNKYFGSDSEFSQSILASGKEYTNSSAEFANSVKIFSSSLAQTFGLSNDTVDTLLSGYEKLKTAVNEGPVIGTAGVASIMGDKLGINVFDSVNSGIHKSVDILGDIRDLTLKMVTGGGYATESEMNSRMENRRMIEQQEAKNIAWRAQHSQTENMMNSLNNLLKQSETQSDNTVSQNAMINNMVTILAKQLNISTDAVVEYSRTSEGIQTMIKLGKNTPKETARNQ